MNRLIILAATAAIAVVALLAYWLFGSWHEAAKQLLPSVLATILVGIMIYLFRRVLFAPVDSFQTNEQLDRLARHLGDRLQLPATAPASDVQLFEQWYAIDWRGLLASARKLEVFVSHMDTWAGRATNDLKDLFDRGGTVRFFLSRPGTEAARRIGERYPYYSADYMEERIGKTAARLEQVYGWTTNRKATLQIYTSDVFCMHVMMVIDDRYLIVSLFDHFRRKGVESPTFVIDLARHSNLTEWMHKEREGWEQHAQPWTGPLPALDQDEPTPLPRPLAS